MKIIDCHVHTAFSDPWMQEAAKKSKVNYSEEGLEKEMRKNNVVYVVSMGIRSKERNLDKNAETPMIDSVEDASIIKIGGINPYRPNLKKTEEAIKSGKIKGVKIYLGYYPFYPYDKVYLPFYKLAEKYKVPVIFHTGDTYSETAFVKYAHPLNVDEIAVKFPAVNFILAHFGNPWLFDSAELLWKNKNVYADLSGFVVGNEKETGCFSPLIIREALKFVNNYNKIIYGSDWPLVPIKEYIKIIKKLIPREHWEKIFFLNARKVFGI